MNTKDMDTARKVAAVREYMSQLNGTEDMYRHGLLPDFLYTDGALFVADTCGAHWLIDLIASWQVRPRVRAEPFQVWTLDFREPLSCGQKVVFCTDGDRGPGSIEVARQVVPYSDFPSDLLPFVFWVENRTLMLPGER